MYKTLQKLEQIKAMAIVRVDIKKRAFEIANGLIEGDIPCMEISFTQPGAQEIIRSLTATYQNTLLVGAGTILDSETARLAILAGAQFIIAPNFALAVARTCNRYRIPYIPGCTSVSEMVEAMEAGAAMIKAFPISNFYGHELVSVLKTPLPYMPIMASGGVHIDTIQDWLLAGVDCIGFGTLLTTGSSADIAKNASLIRNEIDMYQNK